MKQNERILVYLVTGFLAVILVVAVFFGRDTKASPKSNTNETVRGLGDILEQKPVQKPGVANAGSPGGVSQPKVELPAGNNGGSESQPPLVASLPVPAAQRVVELFGESRRDRSVRIVTARPGDSLESIVRRWCGARDPYFDEARTLNEELTILRIGDPVVVPWVDDEVILAAYDARQPRMLADSNRPSPAIQPNASPESSGPTFRSPGGTADPAPANRGAAAGTTTYVVKPNDSLWKIAAQRYGAGNAERMIGEIKRLNGLTSDRLNVDQKLVLPNGS